MPSTYSTHLLLELMADGENEGLWGDITNTNLEILGRAISGSTNVTLVGTTHALSVAQGSLSEGHYSVLVLGGAPTGTNTITIDPNTVPRIYLVKNDSGQDAVFTQGSGGDATVVNGDIGILFSDGGGASASVTDLTPGLMRNSENLSGLADAATALQNLGVTATAAELNALDGATLDISAVTATAAEVNTLDGFTGVTADLNYAKDLRATGVTTTEFDKLDGLTASTAELNILDGATLDTAELNKLDGVTVSTAEINYLDGVTSGIQGQLDGKITSVTAGTDLSGGGSSGSVTISHANTSNQGSVNNGGNTVIQDISLDSNGHVTNINSKTVGETFFESGEITIPSGGVVSVAHGLGSTPRFARVVLRCKSPSRGFSVGDETTFGLDTGAEEGPAPIVHANSNNVFLNMGDSGRIRFIGTDDFFWSNSGRENFKLVFYAMK